MSTFGTIGGFLGRGGGFEGTFLVIIIEAFLRLEAVEQVGQEVAAALTGLEGELGEQLEHAVGHLDFLNSVEAVLLPLVLALLSAVFDECVHVVGLQGAEHVPEEDAVHALSTKPFIWHELEEVLVPDRLRPHLADGQLRQVRDFVDSGGAPHQRRLLFSGQLLQEVQGAVVLLRQLDVL